MAAVTDETMHGWPRQCGTTIDSESRLQSKDNISIPLAQANDQVDQVVPRPTDALADDLGGFNFLSSYFGDKTGPKSRCGGKRVLNSKL